MRSGFEGLLFDNRFYPKINTVLLAYINGISQRKHSARLFALR